MASITIWHGWYWQIVIHILLHVRCMYILQYKVYRDVLLKSHGKNVSAMKCIRFVSWRKIIYSKSSGSGCGEEWLETILAVIGNNKQLFHAWTNIYELPIFWQCTISSIQQKPTAYHMNMKHEHETMRPTKYYIICAICISCGIFISLALANNSTHCVELKQQL